MIQAGILVADALLLNQRAVAALPVLLVAHVVQHFVVVRTVLGQELVQRERLLNVVVIVAHGIIDDVSNHALKLRLLLVKLFLRGAVVPDNLAFAVFIDAAKCVPLLDRIEEMTEPSAAPPHRVLVRAVEPFLAGPKRIDKVEKCLSTRLAVLQRVNLREHMRVEFIVPCPVVSHVFGVYRPRGKQLGTRRTGKRKLVSEVNLIHDFGKCDLFVSLLQYIRRDQNVRILLKILHHFGKTVNRLALCKITKARNLNRFLLGNPHQDLGTSVLLQRIHDHGLVLQNPLSPQGAPLGEIKLRKFPENRAV